MSSSEIPIVRTTAEYNKLLNDYVGYSLKRLGIFPSTIKNEISFILKLFCANGKGDFMSYKCFLNFRNGSQLSKQNVGKIIEFLTLAQNVWVYQVRNSSQAPSKSLDSLQLLPQLYDIYGVVTFQSDQTILDQNNTAIMPASIADGIDDLQDMPNGEAMKEEDTVFWRNDGRSVSKFTDQRKTCPDVQPGTITVKTFGEMTTIRDHSQTEGDKFAAVLSRFSVFLAQEIKVISKLKNKSEKEQKMTDDEWGFRSIQGNRIEILLCDERNRNTMACQHVFSLFWEKNQSQLQSNEFTSKDEVKQYIFENATRLAKQDKRCTEDYVFANYSLILHTGNVDSQIPHVDLLAPHLQFGLMITPNIPGTTAYKVEKKNCVTTPEKFVDFMGLVPNSKICHQILQSFDEVVEAKQLLKDVGLVLCTLQKDNIPKIANQPQSLKSGTVICLPGSTIHAGPLHGDFRAVMFFTAHPRTLEPYNPGTQWYDGLLLCELMITLWKKLRTDARMTFLNKIGQLVRTKCPNLYQHYTDIPTVQAFLKSVANKQRVRDGQCYDQKLTDMASNNEIVTD